MRLTRIGYQGPPDAYRFKLSFRKAESPTGKAGYQLRKVFRAAGESEAWAQARAWRDTYRPACGLGASRELAAALLASIDVRETLGRIVPSTAYAYRRAIECYVRPRFGGIDADELAPYQVVGMYMDLAAGGAPKGRPLAPSTLRKLHSCLNGSFAWLRDMGMVADNPMQNVPRPAGTRPPRRPVSDADLEKVVAVMLPVLADGSSDAAAVRRRNSVMAMFLELMAGVRGCEAMALERCDLDLAGRTIRIANHVSEVPGKGVMRMPGTKGNARRGRWVSIGDEVRRILEAHLAWQDGYLTASGDGTPVITYDGSTVRPGDVTRAFNALAKTVGLPEGVTPHSLRHSHAVQLIAHGISAKETQERLGHARIGTTMDIYANEIVEARDRAGADAMDAMWNEKGGRR